MRALSAAAFIIVSISSSNNLQVEEAAFAELKPLGNQGINQI
jgi:hypothetical protein